MTGVAIHVIYSVLILGVVRVAEVTLGFLQEHRLSRIWACPIGLVACGVTGGVYQARERNDAGRSASITSSTTSTTRRLSESILTVPTLRTS